MTNKKEIETSIDDAYVNVKSLIKGHENINYESFIDEVEIWINGNLEFLTLWERIFNNEEFELDIDDVVTLDTWIDSGALSIIRKDDEIYFHPHILLAHTLNDPMIMINFIITIFSLPQKQLDKFLSNLYK